MTKVRPAKPGTKFKIQTIFCPWCHAPLVFIGAHPIEDEDELIECDRYDCGGAETHTILVMPGIG